jgi:hypothetical protein
MTCPSSKGMKRELHRLGEPVINVYSKTPSCMSSNQFEYEDFESYYLFK